MDIQNQPVYKLYLAKLITETYHLPQEKRDELRQNRDAFLAQVGARVLLAADMAWSNREYDAFGIEEYPSLDALIEYHDYLREVNWNRYVFSKTYLGWMLDDSGRPLAFQMPLPVDPDTQPIYKAYLARPTPMYYENKKAADALNRRINDEAVQAGMAEIMSAYSRANNEEWMIFGLERYPNLDVINHKYWQMEQQGWSRYMQASSYLGRATGGIITGL